MSTGDSLDSKLEFARALLADNALAAGSTHRVAVAWTGGKDSTLALWLWRQVLAQAEANARPLALTVDTGVKFPEIIAFRTELAKDWGLEHRVVYSADPDSPPDSSNPLACCGRLKVAPLKATLRELKVTILISGIRRDEHPSRADRQFVEKRSDPDYVQLNPLLDLNEMDVWAAHLGRAIPYCPLYNQGYRSLGCVPCTASPSEHLGERTGRSTAKDARLEQLTALGYF
ncbi:MAG: phosphoadenosine phosphosulfate reductase family protein [Okeania sp. SIO3B3]|nr:phosphoadenosine phosphosulfate reductase family protein [Okeania sp. SIO3B3]